ncbi:MAG: hypothetical protein WD448_08670 [Woeseia sp.]
MAPDARQSRAAAYHETPEEARDAIASALEFLRDEAAALGMRDVSTLLALARSYLRDECNTRVQKRH